jgi:hypothetical protein
MDRRKSLKTLLIGSIGATSLAMGAIGCKDDKESAIVAKEAKGYGRIASEKLHDEKIIAEGQFFSDPDLALIATLCDLILPATPTAASATEAEVPAFIDFIVKDLPYQQIPIQGGLMWINGESNRRFNTIFDKCTKVQQTEILDDIAYASTPETEKYEAGRQFFNRFRGLVTSGYYSSKIGMKDIGYVGNRPNLWDGVPADVLAEHGFEYEAAMLPKYINHDARDIQAEWDEKANLIS